MAVEMTDQAFDEAVADALDQIPAALMAKIDNVAILVEDDPPPDHPGVLGLYHGIPLTGRDTTYAGVLPDLIFIFRRPLKRHARSTEHLVRQIAVTVVHEIAHYFGFDDAELHELGWG